MKNAAFNSLTISSRLAADSRVIAEAVGEANVTDGASWRKWRQDWRAAYSELSNGIRADRSIMRERGIQDGARSDAQSRRQYGRVSAANLMLLLGIMKARRPRKVADLAA